MGLGFLTDERTLWVVKNIYLDQNKSCGLMSATQKVCAYKVTKGWIHVCRKMTKMIMAQQNLLNGTGFFKDRQWDFLWRKKIYLGKNKSYGEILHIQKMHKQRDQKVGYMFVACVSHVNVTLQRVSVLSKI